MKKAKILFFILIFILAIIIVFSSCKKTNAYTNDLDTPLYTTPYDINAQGNSGFAYIISTDNYNRNFMWLYYSTAPSGYIIDYDINNNRFRLYEDGIIIEQFDVGSFNTNIYYIQLCFDYELEKLYLYLSPILFTTTTQNNIPQITEINLSNNGALWELDNTNFLQNYTSSQPTTKLLLSYGPDLNYIPSGLSALYLFSIEDNFSQDIDEQIEFLWENDISGDIPINYYNYLISKYFSIGWDNGYRDGWDEGYRDGYDDGDDNGYTNGYAQGQRDYEVETLPGLLLEKYDEGYEDGYDIGYNYGYDDGQAGENAISPTFNVLTAIFTSIGSILAVELVPHIPLGLFFLVPLFFAVLGLILWIWRRN